jgi:hypothetical protein
MKRTSVLLIAFAGVFLAGTPCGQARDCSNATLRGAYGFRVGGIVVPAGTPRGVLARFSFDGKGSYSAKLTLNDNGNIIHVEDSGTYTVDADCTGKLFPNPNAGGGTIEIVIVDGGNEFYQLRTAPPFAVNLSNAAKKQFPSEDQ